MFESRAPPPLSVGRKEGRQGVKAGVRRLAQKLLEARKELVAKDRKIFGLEVELAELSKKLDGVTELEKELQHYRCQPKPRPLPLCQPASLLLTSSLDLPPHHAYAHAPAHQPGPLQHIPAAF